MSTNATPNATPKATPKAKKIHSVDELIKMAISINVKGRDAIQAASVAILIHAEKCGDYTKANTLVKGLPDSIRKDSLVQWFVVYGGLVLPDDDGLDADGQATADDAFCGWSGASHIKENFEKAKGTYWDTVKKPPNPWKGFDLDAEIANLVKKANIAMKKHGASPDTKVDKSKLGQLAALAGLVRPEEPKA